MISGVAVSRTMQWSCRGLGRDARADHPVSELSTAAADRTHIITPMATQHSIISCMNDQK